MGLLRILMLLVGIPALLAVASFILTYIVESQRIREAGKYGTTVGNAFMPDLFQVSPRKPRTEQILKVRKKRIAVEKFVNFPGMEYDMKLIKGVSPLKNKRYKIVRYK